MRSREEESVFDDYTNVPSDYGEAVAMMEKARQDFMSLPSKVRERFDNDVQGLIYFIQNPNNRSEAEELGLIERKHNKRKYRQIQEQHDY